MGLKNGACIGLEISRESISAALLEFKGNTVFLKSSGKIEIPPSLINPSLREENISDAEEFKEAIKPLCKNIGISGKHIAVAMPDDSVKFSFLEFEDIPKDREKVVELIKWNLKKTLPFPVDEAVVDFQIIDAPSEKNPSYKLAIILMRKPVLDQYERLLNACNLTPAVILPSSLAVYNLYHDLLPKDKSCCLITASKKRINIICIRDRRPFFQRSKEVDDERRGISEILASLNYYQDIYQALPDEIYFVDIGFGFAYLKAEMEGHAGLRGIKPLNINEIIKGANPSLNNLSAAAGAALKNNEQ